MLPAELKGKVSLTQPPTERMEDVLTSHVFSLFRYMDNLQLPVAFLNEAVNLRGERLALGPAVAARPFFWPKYRLGTSPRLREFDVVLFLYLDGGGRVALGVENKYRSGPSATAPDAEGEPPSEEADAPAFTGNQLADEYQGLRQAQWYPEACGRERAAAQRAALLYITKDYVLPRQELAAAVEKVRGRLAGTGGAPPEMERDLYWLSWHALHGLLTAERRRGFDGYRPGERNLLEDLLQILDRRDLREFRPFDDLREVSVYVPMFPGGLIPDRSAPVGA